MIIYAVDDEQMALGMIEDVVKEVCPDATLKLFLDSKILLNEIKENRCDIVLLDVRMPGISGIEAAQRIKEMYKDINIIFVTGYDNYTGEAMRLFASGYLTKPIDSSSFKAQLENLRYPIQQKSIFAKTFGYFTFLVDNKPVEFTRSKSKELLALLVQCRGSLITRRELAILMNENSSYSRNEQKYISKIALSLKEDLEKCHIAEILYFERKGLRINDEMIACDLYDCLDKKCDNYRGEYMEQYSWAENYKNSVLSECYRI